MVSCSVVAAQLLDIFVSEEMPKNDDDDDDASEVVGHSSKRKSGSQYTIMSFISG